MDNQAEKIRLGVAAAQLLKDETLNHVFNTIANEQFVRFSATNASGEVEREKIWSVMQCMDLVRQKLVALEQSGKMEQQNRDHDGKS